MTPFFTEDQGTYSGINQINDYLFISGLSGAMNLEELKKSGITAVIDLCETIYYEAREGIDTYRYPLLDGFGNPLENIELVLATITDLKNKGHKILVHCFAGVSRSGSICAGHIAQTTGKSFMKALEEVNRARSCVDPNKGMITTLRKVLKEIGD